MEWPPPNPAPSQQQPKHNQQRPITRPMIDHPPNSRCPLDDSTEVARTSDGSAFNTAAHTSLFGFNPSSSSLDTLSPIQPTSSPPFPIEHSSPTPRANCITPAHRSVNANRLTSCAWISWTPMLRHKVTQPAQYRNSCSRSSATGGEYRDTKQAALMPT